MSQIYSTAAVKFFNTEVITEVIMKGSSRKLPIGIQSFEIIRESGFLYVDKTAYIDRLVSTGVQYFLSRPRRFGKSLLLSMLRAYWEGKKELFSGLAIESLRADDPGSWKSYPMFYIDFNRANYQQNIETVEDILNTHLEEWEKVYGCESKDASLPVRFQNLLVRAYTQTGLRCVVLVDEYDKPLLESLSDPDQEEHKKAVLKGFFSALKSFDRYLQFVFISGVTKFSKVSIFSDLNQLEDISLDEEYAAICGITEEELSRHFLPETEQMAEANHMSLEECLEMLKKTYDGYHFSSDTEGNSGVYNPYSLLSALKKKKFNAFWFETGTPTFLVKRLKEIQFDVRQFTGRTIYATDRILSDYRGDNPDPVPLLYQTGYLTILDYIPSGNYYVLGFPNDEVKYGFLESLMPEYVTNTGSGSGKDILTLQKCIQSGQVDQIRDIFISLFASIPYTSAGDPFENYFQAVLYIVFTLLNQYVHCELRSASGRADCIVETDKYVYLFEFKRDGTAAEALQQIQEQGYALPYAADPRILYKIGVSFGSKSRMLEDWKVEISNESSTD